METFSEILRWVQNLAFLGVGIWALLEWRRRGDDQAGWLGATFGTLALVVLLGIVSDNVSDTTVADAITRVTLAGIAFFPYLLLRFMGSFEPLSRLLGRGALLAAVALTVWGLLLPDLPETGEPRGTVFTIFVLVFVVDWFAMLSIVARRFWRAGRGQPTLARRRLRILSIASVALGLVLLLAGAAGGDPEPWFTVVTQVLGLSSAVLFAIGFVPPGTLRTAWRQPEEQRLHEASLRLMTATSPQEVGRTLAPHMVAVVGARAVTIVDRGEVVGREGIELPEARAIAVADDLDGHDDLMTVDLAHGRIFVWTNRYTPFFGQEELWLLGRLALLADLALDRTGLLARERAMRRELELTNKELESFVYTASHDLKSPLIAMLGYLEVIETEYSDQLGDEGDWYVERMLTNGRYMESLITDLLELSRVGRMQTEPDEIDLHAIVQGMADELAARYPNATYVVDELPKLWTNPTRARQLLGNLMENAGKYGGEGITVRVSAHLLEDGGIELQVADDGVGIPEAYAEKVFGVFERLDPDDAQSGTGIGLAICRKIVESIGGHIWLAESEQGADFRIRLPADVVRDDAPAAPPTSQEVPA